MPTAAIFLWNLCRADLMGETTKLHQFWFLLHTHAHNVKLQFVIVVMSALWRKWMRFCSQVNGEVTLATKRSTAVSGRAKLAVHCTVLPKLVWKGKTGWLDIKLKSPTSASHRLFYHVWFFSSQHHHHRIISLASASLYNILVWPNHTFHFILAHYSNNTHFSYNIITRWLTSIMPHCRRLLHRTCVLQEFYNSDTENACNSSPKEEIPFWTRLTKS